MRAALVGVGLLGVDAVAVWSAEALGIGETVGETVNVSAAGEATLRRIPPFIPPVPPWVIKGGLLGGSALCGWLIGGALRMVVEQRFALRRVTAYASYTWTDGSQFPRWGDVVVAERPDERCLALYEQQGHGRDWVRSIFAAGQALACTIYRDAAPAATCFAFRNFEHIWEIGGLYTAPSERRMGLGRRVVETALHELAARDLAPRYVIHEEPALAPAGRGGGPARVRDDDALPG